MSQDESALNARFSYLLGLNHELRNPLNAVLGFVDLLLMGIDGPLSENAESDLRLVQSNARKLLELINQIMDLARIETGRLALAQAPARLADVFAQTVEVIGAELVEVDETDALAQADAPRLKQALAALGLGALECMRAGKLRLSAASADGRARVHLTLVGGQPRIDLISAALVGDLTGQAGKGEYGLRLPLGRRLAELHGGQVSLETPEDAPAYFAIDLPAA